MDMLQIKPVKMPRSNTFRNIGILQVKMKKLGFDAFKLRDDWLDFGRPSLVSNVVIDYCYSVTVCISNVIVDVSTVDLDMLDKMPAIRKAIMEFYKSEGIVD